ncbi:MAG TPA: hypothetical protein VE567_00630 [Sphingomonas sp.]|nr:hypothetical protein [Sphingomonas sp.]
MVEYKLYCLDRNGRILRRHEIEASDDGIALDEALKFHPEMARELWCGTRKVGVLPPSDEPAGRAA